VYLAGCSAVAEKLLLLLLQLFSPTSATTNNQKKEITKQTAKYTRLYQLKIKKPTDPVLNFYSLRVNVN
jgi:hypothetical protein